MEGWLVVMDWGRDYIGPFDRQKCGKLFFSGNHNLFSSKGEMSLSIKKPINLRISSVLNRPLSTIHIVHYSNTFDTVILMRINMLFQFYIGTAPVLSFSEL